jgi:hypothetical protein
LNFRGNIAKVITIQGGLSEVSSTFNLSINLRKRKRINSILKMHLPKDWDHTNKQEAERKACRVQKHRKTINKKFPAQGEKPPRN